MGNNHSTAHHNRLSKPKTNTNPPSLAGKAESQLAETPPFADLSADGRQQITESSLSPFDSEFGSTAWSNKDDTNIEPTAPIRGRALSIISRSNSRTHSRSNSLSFFGSKHGSKSKLGGFADSKVSLVSNGQIDLETTIKLLQEVKKNASPEDLAALHEALETDGESSPPVVEPGLSRNNSLLHRSSSSLTRQRSLLQTPGVATRNSPVEGRRRTWNSWKAPQLDPEEEAKWRKRTPKVGSPVVRLSAREFVEDGRRTPTQRAQTPGEMDYAHLGSLKPGTLMVINRAPSPAPSAKLSKSNPHNAGDTDYFSAVEADSGPLMMKTTTRRGHARSQSAISPATTPLYESDRAMSRMTPRNGQAYGSVAVQAHASQIAREPTERAGKINESVFHQRQNANEIAQGYQAEIPASPFATSRAGQLDDQNKSSMRNDEGSYRVEAARILQGTMFELDASSEATVSTLTAMPCEANSRTQEPKADRRPLPRTTDSGYSSGSSVWAFDRKQWTVGVPAVSSQWSSSPHQQENALEAFCSQSNPEAMRIPSISYEQTQPPVVYAAHEQRRPAALKIFELSSRSSVGSLASESTLSPQTPQSVSSKRSFDSSSSIQKRLQRRRHSQADILVVQSCQSIPEGTIPEVPENVRREFARRLSDTPGMECLTNTYLSKDHVLVSEPSLDTSSPYPSTFHQPAEIEPARPPTPPAHGRRRGLSMFRRKSYVETKAKEKMEDAPTLDVIDLGTIATSLGTSPYDIAMPGVPGGSVTSPTHPHQLGNSLPKAKSTLSMDSQSAAEFARLRSKDRAAIVPELPQQRRRSYYNLTVETGEAKAAKRRPQSYAHDIPPVPLIDSSKHIDGPADRSRPQSEVQRMSRTDTSLNARHYNGGQVVSEMEDRYDDNGPTMAQQGADAVTWKTRSKLWSQRRKSMGDGLRANPGMAEASASFVNSRQASDSRKEVESWGRFSGGLEYNYMGQGAIAGSAGTQSAHKLASSKSMQWKVQHGVDLSDVPIMFSEHRVRY